MTPDRAGVRVVPALSAEEWRAVGPNGVGHPPMPSTLDDVSYLSEGDLPKALAIVNDALPAASPYRVTREDVAALRALVTDADDFEIATHAHDWDALARLAAKLDALLRPSDG